METVTRRDLAEALKEEYGGTIEAHDSWIIAFVDLVSRKIAEKGRVEIRGFGSFNLSTIRAHTTVNPSVEVEEGQKRKKMRVPESYTVDFRTSKTLKELLREEQAKQKKAKKKKSKSKKSKSKPKKTKKETKKDE